MISVFACAMHVAAKHSSARFAKRAVVFDKTVLLKASSGGYCLLNFVEMGTGARSVISTSSAADVQKVRPVMQ